MRRGGERSRGPGVAPEVTGEDEGDGGVVWRLLPSHGSVAARCNEVRFLKRIPSARKQESRQ